MEPTRRRGTCGSNATSSGRRCLGSIWNFWCKEAKRSAVLLGPMEGLARGIYQLGTCSKLYRSGALDTRIRGATEEEAKSMEVLSKRSALFPRGARRQKTTFHLRLRLQWRRTRVSTWAQGPRKRNARCSLLHVLFFALLIILAAARRARRARRARGTLVVLLLLGRPIRAQGVVDDGDLLVGDESVAQLLRMRLANDSSVRKAQEILTALPTSTRASKARLMLWTSASKTGSPEMVLAAPARRVRGTARSPVCWVRLTL
jgi:hypothetical protein